MTSTRSCRSRTASRCRPARHSPRTATSRRCGRRGHRCPTGRRSPVSSSNDARSPALGAAVHALPRRRDATASITRSSTSGSSRFVALVRALDIVAQRGDVRGDVVDGRRARISHREDQPDSDDVIDSIQRLSGLEPSRARAGCPWRSDRAAAARCHRRVLPARQVAHAGNVAVRRDLARAPRGMTRDR